MRYLLGTVAAAAVAALGATGSFALADNGQGNSEPTTTTTPPAMTICEGTPVFVLGKLVSADTTAKSATVLVIRSSDDKIASGSQITFSAIAKFEIGGHRQKMLSDVPAGAYVSADAVICTDGSYQAKNLVVHHFDRHGHRFEKKAEMTVAGSFTDKDGDNDQGGER